MSVRERVREVVVREVERLLSEEGVENPSLPDSTELVVAGIDSLGFAVLITRLEEALDVDPFLAIETAEVPRTVADLVDLYTTSLSRTGTRADGTAAAPTPTIPVQDGPETHGERHG
jgi:acyl carrier protein